MPLSNADKSTPEFIKTDNPTIRRRDFKSDPLSFESLRSEAINLVQNISGNLWTDYNAGDPGVTLLEALCFGVSDTIYKTQTDIANILCDEAGNVPYQDLALHSPDKVFPCRPTTISDYRKMFLNDIPELSNIWIVADGESGLYRIKVELKPAADCSCDGLDGKDESRLKSITRKIYDVFSRSRNVSEDIGSIELVESRLCSLVGAIEIQDPHQAEKTMAAILQCVSDLVSQRPITQSYSSAVSQGLPLEEIFDGPLLKNKYILNKNSDISGLVDNPKIFSSIGRISNVIQILNVSLDFHDKTQDESLPVQLAFPESSSINKLKLMYNETEIELEWCKVLSSLSQSNFDDLTGMQKDQGLSLTFDMPKGSHRDLESYHSIEQLLPEIYRQNIGGSHNDSLSSPLQLSSYSLIFEQFLANFGSNLNNIKELFSVTCNKENSYHFQILSDDQFVGAKSIYSPNVHNYFDSINRFQDDFWGRKSSAVDFILSLYGESLSSDLFTHLKWIVNEKELEKLIVVHKIAFLNNVCILTRDRASGLNYRNYSESVSSVFHQRLSFFLGIFNASNVHITDQLNALSLTISQSCKSIFPESQFNYSLMESKSTKLVGVRNSSVNGKFVIHSVPYLDDYTLTPFSELRNLLEGIIGGMQSKFPKSLLTCGGNLIHYNIVESEQGHQFDLVFTDSLEDFCFLIKSYGDKISSVKAANYLSEFCKRLYQMSDAFHIVEHVLLGDVKFDRPRLGVSIIFPVWNAHTLSSGYSDKVKRLVESQCPAHVLADCYWLTFDEMMDFEKLFYPWLMFMSTDAHTDASVSTLTNPSKELAQWIMNFNQVDKSGNVCH